MSKLAAYTHSECFKSSKLYEEIPFVGYSMPHFRKLHTATLKYMNDFPQLPLRKAPGDDFLTVHSADYVNKIRQMARGEEPEEMPWLSMECRGYEFFLEGYNYSLGGFYQAIDAMKAGNLERALVTAMPGHHAFKDRGHGYCMFNPMAASVRYAQKQGFEKILILDWDIHHGDGTQSIFEHDKNVYHISSHNLIDLYMTIQRVIRLGTTPYAESVGQCNVPFLPAYFPDDILNKFDWTSKFYRAGQSLSAIQDALDHAPFSPDLIYIFASFDSHRDDQGKNITDWTNEDFQTLTRMVLDKAKQFHCPVISDVGGGYIFDVTVAATRAHIETFARYS